MQTETLAQLYLQQGYPERAAPIFEKLLAQDPGCSSAAEGLSRCKTALAARRAEGGMDKQKRLQVLQEMLDRLTGEIKASKPASGLKPNPVADSRQRRLKIFQTLLKRLKQGKPGGQPAG